MVINTAQDIKLWRRNERERLVATRLAASPDLHRRWSREVERRLSSLLRDMAGQTIGLYWPLKGEFDPRPLADGLAAQGRRIALPAITDKGKILEYRLWQPGAEIENGAYGIPAPKARQVVLPDILLVPLLGFDRANYRLGYGGGYFDRTLAALAPQPTTIGVGFETARLATVFPQAHDIAMGLIVTETGIQRQTTYPK